MLWTRALKTLFKNPLYLVMTLLPVLLVALLFFPIFQSFTGIFDTLFEVTSQSQFFEGYNPYYDYYDMELPNDVMNTVFSALLPILGSVLVILVIELLTALLLTPISLQYLGDATRLGYVPVGFAGRGLKRMWWKPYVFSIIISVGMNIISSVIISPLNATIGLFYFSEDAASLLASFGIVFFLFMIISLYLNMATGMFYGSIAMEERPFGSAMGRGFARGFKRFWPLLGANLLVGLISGIAVFAVIGFYAFHSMDMFTAMEAVQDYEEIIVFLDKIFNDFCILLSVFSVIAWFGSAFIMSYTFQQTQYQIGREQAAAAAAQSRYEVYQQPTTSQQDVWQQPEQPQQDTWQQPEQPQQDTWQQPEQPQQDTWQQPIHPEFEPASAYERTEEPVVENQVEASESNTEAQ